ncbi:MAG: MaoC family dehydratase N-terminal domain-containing protein [Chloroflexi bacterium]|nr:MaoC family dehydratase N-terminal domain-containing protein [Chloroflexota bacterium]OJV92163.1 MAG: acyl dehydratase [Chloroflexi bacterium 54-19]
MIDKSFIGWVSPPSTVEVEKGRLRFFAKAIGETNPLYTNEEAAQAAGYRSLPLPLTFLFCLEMENPSSFKLLETLKVSLARILHGEQSFTYHYPVCAGDCVTFQSTVSDIYSKKGGALEFIVQETTARNQDGVLVGEMRNTIVVRN